VKAAPPMPTPRRLESGQPEGVFDWTEIRYHPFCACIWQFLARGFRPLAGRRRQFSHLLSLWV
jgi:hypothetical protein